MMLAMSPITTHVLDTTRGLPAEGVLVDLDYQEAGGNWKHLARGKTDADGRLNGLLEQDYTLPVGVYRMVFSTAAYFEAQKVAGFYPSVTVTFEVREHRHYHVPLLLSPFGYSTYRGS